MSAATRYWLLKAEPDTRVVKGKDVKFSVDDFESIKTSPWEGVRNYEARNLMKEMKVGEKALFYHSNCKNPGIAGFAEVSKEAYPDYTAWDASHPYYDPKTKEDDPRWFMVDLTFSSRAQHFVPLSLLRLVADHPNLPDEIKYIGDEGASAIKEMDLVRKGRLSVQRVDERAWNAINLLTQNGGWEEMDLKPKKGLSKKYVTGAKPKATSRHGRSAKGKRKDQEGESEAEEEAEGDGGDEFKPVVPKKTTRKRKAPGESYGEGSPVRRSIRAKR